jgi:hypothetical protein
MRNLKNIFLAVLFLMAIISTSAQTVDIVNQSNPDKATVYIVRISGLGALINFKYFIGENYIGKCNYGKYLKLTLDEGDYLIWARAENSSYMEAKLEAGKTYIINAVPKMGAVKASVKLEAFHEIDEKTQKKLDKNFENNKLIEFSQVELLEGQAENIDQIVHGLEKYHEMKAKGEEIPVLNMPVVLN